MKALSSRQYSCQHLSQAMLWCVKVFVCAIQYVPSTCMAVYSLLNVKEYIFMLCESVYICVQIQRMCVSMWFYLNVCGEYAFTHTHTHTREYLCFFMYIQSFLCSFPAHFVCSCERARSYVYASVREQPKCFYAYIQSFLIYPIFVGVCMVSMC